MDKKFKFKLDKDKIKLQLQDLGKKIIKKNSNFRGAILVLIFFVLLGFGYAIYNDGTKTDPVQNKEEKISSEIVSDKEETGKDDQPIFYNNPYQRQEDFSLNYPDVKENENSNREQLQEKENRTVGVITESVKPVTDIRSENQGIELLRPVSGKIKQDSGWYYHPVFGDWRYKEGIEIVGNSGQIVMAAADGQVLSVKEDDYKGILVILKHQEGWFTEYGHLQKTTVSPGDRIAKGQEIGRIGSTGITDGPSLYFSLKNQDQVIDPINYFER